MVGPGTRDEVLLLLGEQLLAAGGTDVVAVLKGAPGLPQVCRVTTAGQLHERLTESPCAAVVLDLAATGARSPELLDLLHEQAPTTGLVLLPEVEGPDLDEVLSRLAADDLVLREELATRHLVRAVSAAVRRAYLSREHRLLADRTVALSASCPQGPALTPDGVRFQAALLDGIPQSVIVTDPQARILFWNPAAQRLFGWSAEEAVGRPVTEITPRVDSDAQVDDIARAVERGQPWGGDEVLRRRDGTEFQALVSVAPVYDEQGALVALVGVSSDITERKQAEQRYRTLSAIVASMADAVLTHDMDGVVQTWNAGAEQLLGWSAEEAVGSHVRDLFAAGQAPGDVEIGIGIVAAGEVFREHEIIGRHHDGSRIDLSLTASPVLDEHGAVVAASVIARDVSERRRLAEELQHQATHDALTGLPNRALLEDRLAHTLAAAERSRAPVAVLFVDLDDFKTVNDVHGHLVGDAMLVELAHRFRSVTRPSDTVARFGGDEFVIVCDDTDEAAARLIAERVAEACRPPVEIDALRLQASASIGIAVGPPLESDGSLLLRCADSALYRAKAEGRGRWHVHGPAVRFS